jgi:V/A-type H+-transporting ATPase subunit C
MVDILYTDGVIAAREKYLLKDKIPRMCSLSAEEAFRLLTESGFGGGEGASVYEYDKLLSFDERTIDEFVREYAPGLAESAYLLSTRDFHNAKALVKSGYLKCDPERMLAPDGIIPAESLAAAIKSGDFSTLSQFGELGKAIENAVKDASAYLESGQTSGAEVGLFFERGMYAYLLRTCKKNKMLKKLVIQKIDMTNILTYLRAPDDNTLSEFGDADYKKFVKVCLAAKQKKLPFTEAERMRDNADFDFLNANKYELKKSQPFLYYVFRRKLENENVRIIFVCLLCGMGEKEIKVRLRGEC